MSAKLKKKMEKRQMEKRQMNNSLNDNFQDKIKEALRPGQDTLILLDNELQNKMTMKLLWSLRQTSKMLANKSISYTKIIRAVGNAFYKEFGDLRASDGYEAYYIAEVLDKTVIIASWENDVLHEAKYSIKDNSIEFTPRDAWVEGDYKFAAS